MATRQAAGTPATRRSIGTRIQLAAAGTALVIVATAGIAAHQLTGHTGHSQTVIGGPSLGHAATMGGYAEWLAMRTAATMTNPQTPLPAIGSVSVPARPMGGYAESLRARTATDNTGACGVTVDPLTAQAC
jgi:hypothetical protein